MNWDKLFVALAGLVFTAAIAIAAYFGIEKMQPSEPVATHTVTSSVALSDEAAWKLGTVAAYQDSKTSLATLSAGVSRGDAAAEYGLGIFFKALVPSGYVINPLLDDTQLALSRKFPREEREYRKVLASENSTDARTEHYREALRHWQAATKLGDAAAKAAISQEWLGEISRMSGLLASAGFTPEAENPNAFQVDSATYREACHQMMTLARSASSGNDWASGSALELIGFIYSWNLRNASPGLGLLIGTECDHYDPQRGDALMLKAANLNDEGAVDVEWETARSASDERSRLLWQKRLANIEDEQAELGVSSAKVFSDCLKNEDIDEYKNCMAANTGQTGSPVGESANPANTDQSDQPVEAMNDQQLSDWFKCPENLAISERITATADYLAWARSQHPDWSVSQTLEHRGALLEEHGCASGQGSP